MVSTPLLMDNTSWFIAADFDKQKWAADCLTFMNVCKEKEIPVYLERSRSGKEGHVWIFFDQPCPAIISRKVIATLIEQSGIISVFEKASSFDRLFPNQDRLSGKDLGNLIALPLHKPAWERGNSCLMISSCSHIRINGTSFHQFKGCRFLISKKFTIRFNG